MIDRRPLPQGERASSDRRDGRRAPFVAAVKAVGGGVELALSHNLGEQGMELRRAARSSWQETPLTLAFELPDGDGLVELSAALVFERADGRYLTAGVRFESVLPRDRARIVRYLDAYR